MKRIISVVLSAFAGATVGYVINQILDMRGRSGGIEPDAIVVGTPPVAAGAAALVGVIFGRSRFGAFLAGAAVTAAVGDTLDRSMPPMSELVNKLKSMRPAREG